MTSAPPTPGSRVLVIGEALVDVVGGRPHPGGSPANVAVALGRQGVDVTLATQLGHDEYGDLLHAHLSASHVQVVAAPARRTSTATAVVGPEGAATYSFDVGWDPVFPVLPRADVVHVGSFSALGVDPPKGWLSYDVNVRPALMPDDAVGRVEALASRAHLVKASADDLEWLYPARPARDAALGLLALGPEVAWLTLGADGAEAFTRHDRIVVPASAVAVVDTIGAGDAFSAGLLKGWLDWGPDWERVGRFAADLAAWTVGRRGADPPWA